MQTTKPETKTAKSNMTFTKRTRLTKYIVGVHFNPTGKENINDKILRLIKNDIANGKS
jgi:hypothetical protein